MHTKCSALLLTVMLIATPQTHATAVQTATAQSAITQSAQAQTAPASATWAALAALPPGARLRITMKSGEKLKATYNSANDERLVVFVGKREQQIRRGEVQSNHQVRGSVARATGTGALIGGATGGALGGIFGGIIGSEDGGSAAAGAAAGALGLGALGGGIGAGVGALVGAVRRKRTLIYRAP